jgi:hypothetical protein
MKTLRIVLIGLTAALVLASCAGLAQGAVSGALGSITGGASSSVASASASTVAVDFQNGEVLSSPDARKMMEAGYYVSKVLTPASAATKNQAEVVFIGDGKKSWVNYVVNSRKATKADYTVGATVFYLGGWANHDKISADTYRKSGWALGTITSTEELFKNLVEIDGDSYYVDYLRVPTDPIK